MGSDKSHRSDRLGDASPAYTQGADSKVPWGSIVNDTPFSITQLEQDQSALRAKILASRKAILSIHSDLQYQRETSHHRHQFYHQTALQLYRLVSRESQSVELAEIVSQLEADYNSLISQDQAVARLESDIVARLRYLQTLESEEQIASSRILLRTGVEPPSAALRRFSVAESNTSVPIPSGNPSTISDAIHPVLQDYYSRTGDVRYLEERLLDLHNAQYEDLLVREMLRDQDRPLDSEDSEFARAQQGELEELEQHIDIARRERDLASTLCQALGLHIDLPNAKSGSSTLEDEANTASASQSPYETIYHPKSIADRLLMSEERSSIDRTGPLEGSHTPVRRTRMDKARARQPVTEWIQDVEPILPPMTLLAEPSVPSMPRNEEIESQGLEPTEATLQRAEDVEASFRHPTSTTEPEAQAQANTAAAKALRVTNQKMDGAPTQTTLNTESLPDAGRKMSAHSSVPTNSSPRRASSIKSELHQAIERSKGQIRCPITKRLRALMQRHKSGKPSLANCSGN